MFKRSLLALVIGVAGILWAHTSQVLALPATSALSSVKTAAAIDDPVVKATFGKRHKTHKAHRGHVKSKRHKRAKKHHREKKARWWKRRHHHKPLK